MYLYGIDNNLDVTSDVFRFVYFFFFLQGVGAGWNRF